MVTKMEEPEYELPLPEHLKAYKGEKFIPDLPEKKRERFMRFKQEKIPFYALSPWEQHQFQAEEFTKLQSFGQFQWDIHQQEMERQQAQWADRLTRHRGYISELSDEEYDAYAHRQEKKRLLMIQGFEDKYGWSLEDALEYGRGVGRKVETAKDWAKWMTPAQIQAQEASNQEKVTEAERILWQIATPNALQLSDERFLDFTYYKQQWLWSKNEGVPWEFNVQESLDALVVPYIEPSIEDLEVGTELDHWDAILYGIDIPEGSILRIDPSEEVVLTLIDEEGNETHPEWSDIKPWNIGETQILDYTAARELGFSRDELGGYEESQFEIKLGEEAHELVARLDTDGWEYHEDMVIKPDGAILNYDELEEEIERARVESVQWAQEFEDRLWLDTSVRYVFPDIRAASDDWGQATTKVIQLLEDSPEEFWARIREVGRNVDTERILNTLFGVGVKKGLTREEVAEIFGEPPPITWENALTAIPQNAWNFFSKTMPEAWFGKEDVAEKVFPAAKIIAEKFGPITDIWGEWLPDPSDYMEAASVIAELSDKYIFFPWRLAIAKTLVAAEQDPEAHDIEFMNEVTRLQQEFGQYGYAIRPEMIEAYDRWIEASRGWGTATYWISELTNPVLWLPYGKVVKAVKWYFKAASVPIKAITPTARAEFLATQLERVLLKLEQATGPKAVVLRTRAASLELRLADVSVTMANEIRTSTAGAFLRELKLKYPDLTPQFERVFEPIFSPPMVGDGTMTLVGSLKSIAPVIPTSIDDTVRFLMANHPGRLGQGAYGRWIKHANELDSLLKAGNIHRKKTIELGDAMADHFSSTIDLLLPPLGAKRLYQRGGIDSVWVIKEGQIVGGSGRIIGSKSGAPMIEGKVSHAWGDVIQNHKLYNFADERVHDWCEAAFKVIDELALMAEGQGLTFNRLFFGPLEHYFPRGSVRGLKGVVEEQIIKVGVTPLSTTTPAMRKRIFQFMQESLELGHGYGMPREAFESYIKGVYRAIGNKQYISYLEQSQLGFFSLPAGQTQKIVNLLSRAIQGKAVKAPKWLVEAKPELAERIGAILRMPLGAERTAALKELETNLRAQLPDWLTSATAKAEIATSQATKVARLEPIIKAIQRGDVPHPATMRWIEKNYPEIMPRINELISSTRGVLERSIASRFRQQNLALTVEKLGAELDAVQIRMGQVTGSAKKALEITEASLKAEFDIATTLAGKGTIESKIAHLRENLNLLQDTLGRRTTPFGRDMPGAAYQGVPGYILDAQERIYSKFIKAVDLGSREVALSGVERIAMFKKLLNEVGELTRLAGENAKGFAVERASAMDMASRVGFTESMTRIPGLQGRVFNPVTVNGRTYSGKEVVAMIEKSLAEKAPRWMEMISELSRGLVTLQAALDASAPFIQGIPTVGIDMLNLLKGKPTAIWATSAAKHLYVMLNPRYLSAYRAKNAEIYSRYLKEGLITASDLSDFYRGIKLINNTMGKIPVLGKVPKTAYGRTQIGFGAWGEIARIEIIKSLEWSWLKGGGTRAELAEFVNILTGVISTRGMGVGATQRAFESMTLFAPRYFRANLMLISALGKEGMTGKMARQAVAGAAAGWMIAYCALSALAGQEPRLKPWPQNVEILGMKGDGATAYTIKFWDEYIGPPGFPYSVMRTFTKLIAIGLSEPNRLLKFDIDELIKNHPELQFFLYKSGPIVSLGYEMLMGRDVMGYKLETPGDYMEQIYENFLSIATQSIVTEDPPASLFGFITELGGLRRLSELAWEKFDEYAAPFINKIQDNELDEVQLQLRTNEELRFWDLDIFTRDRMLTDDPKLQEFLDEARKWSARRNSDEEMAIDAKREEIDNWYTSEETTRLDKLRDPDVDWNMVDFRRDLGDLAGDGHERRLHELEEAFPEYYAEIDKRATEGLEDAPSFDVFYWKMYNWVFGPDTEDKYGDPIWSLIDQRLNELKAAYPEEYMDMFMFVKEFGYGDKDPLIFFIWEQKWKLRDFWESTADEFGERDKDKEEGYRKHPDNLDMEAALLFLGYRSTIMNPDAEEIVRQWCDEYDVALRDISLFSKWMIPEDMMRKYGITDTELGKQFDLLPTTGYERKWFYQENPEFYKYRLGEGQITKEIDFNVIPTREEWPLIEAYEAAPTEPREIRRVLRCKSRLLDDALARTGRVSVHIYNTPECAELIAKEGEPPKPWEVRAGAVEFFEKLK